MTSARHSRRARAARRPFAAAAVMCAIALALTAPGMALAVFSSTPSAQTAGVTAATISPPTGFTATAAGASTASLSWTAPATLTGYALSQSPGTLAGCSSTPSSGTTSCTATGLSPATTYTWTLAAVYNNWDSTSVQASAETSFGYTDLGNGTASCVLLSLLCTGPTVTTTSGGNELIFVYLKGTLLSSSPVSGVSGPFTSASQVASVEFPASTSGNYLYVFKATGNGATGAVTVSFSTLSVQPTAWVDVVQLGSGESALGCSGCTDSGTTTSGNENATVTVTVQHAADSEIAFLGSTNGTFTAPSGFAAIAGGGANEYGTYDDLVVQSSASFSMGAASLTWGSIGVEIQP
jgi:large repetitive protein